MFAVEGDPACFLFFLWVFCFWAKNCSREYLEDGLEAVDDFEAVEAMDVIEEARDRVPPLWERGRSSSDISWRDGEDSKLEN